jgi:hypothetical protein
VEVSSRFNIEKPLGWAICLGVGHPGPWWIGSLMEKPAFTRANLSDVRVIMAILRVLMEELLCQVVTGWVLVLRCLWLCPVMPDIKWHWFPRTQLHWHLPGTEKPPDAATRGPGLC